MKSSHSFLTMDSGTNKCQISDACYKFSESNGNISSKKRIESVSWLYGRFSFKFNQIFQSFTSQVNNQLSLMFSRANCFMDLLMEKKEIYDLCKKSMIELSSAIEPLLSLNPIPNGMVLHTPKSLTDVSLANTIKMASLLPITSLRMTFFFCSVEEHSCCLGGGFQMAHSR